MSSSLSRCRFWFSPTRPSLVDVAASEGLVERDDDDLVVAFDATHTANPDGFHRARKSASRSTFERVLDAVIDGWHREQTAVAGINALPADSVWHWGRSVVIRAVRASMSNVVGRPGGALMVKDSISDGRRIAQLLASEVTGHERSLSSLSVPTPTRTWNRR